MIPPKAAPQERDKLYHAKLTISLDAPVALLLAELEDVALDDLAQTPSDHAAIAVAAARVATTLIMAQGLVEPTANRIALDFAMLIQQHARRTG